MVKTQPDNSQRGDPGEASPGDRIAGWAIAGGGLALALLGLLAWRSTVDVTAALALLALASLVGLAASQRREQRQSRLLAQVRAEQATERQALERSAAELKLLQELAGTIGTAWYLPEILLQTASALSQCIKTSDIVFLLTDETERYLLPQAALSTSGRAFQQLWPERLALQEDALLHELMRQQRPQITSLEQPAQSPWQAQALERDIAHLLVLPLCFQEQSFGLALASMPAAQTPYNQELSLALATTAAMVIAHTRLFARARRAALLEERSRLARQLHDSVTQELFSITLTAQAAGEQILRNPERAIEQTRRVQQVAQHALGEMRNLLLQLRPTPLREGGLVDALREHIARVSCLGSPGITLTVCGQQRAMNGHERHLYRIAQEALSNILHHAQASQVEVRLNFGERFLLEVCDNGKGFAPEQALAGKQLGLRTMAERAAALGGQLQIQSSPGTGTTVAVELPYDHKTA